MVNNIPLNPPDENFFPLYEIDPLLSRGIELISLDTLNKEELFILFHGGIRSSVYVGTHILTHIPPMIKRGTEHAAVVMLYRHVLDLGDSISTLFRFGSVSAISILIRSIFESWLALEFILEGKTLQKDRSLAYWAHYQIKRLEMFTKYDPRTQQGKDFHAVLQATPQLSKAEFIREDHSADRKGIETILSQDKFKPFYDNYIRLKKGKKPRHWYSLCSNANDLRSLAKNLGKEAQYLIFYSHLSEIAHSADVITDRLGVSEDGKTLMMPLRGPANRTLKMWATTTSTYLLQCHSLIIEFYFPPDDSMRKSWQAWYTAYRKFNKWLSEESV